jgi:signal transduction histidine kinase
VADRLFSALAVLRVVVLINAVGLNIWRWDSFERPELGVLVVLAFAAWTAFALWAYREAARRTAWLLTADLLVGLAAILVSPLVTGGNLQATIPGFWVMGPLLAWAIQWHWRGGLFAAAVLSAADLAVRPDITETNYGNVFLLMIGGPIVGYVCESLQRMAAERDRAERAAAAEIERARLARAVHDGVLQVLSLVQRRGTDLGGEFAELGRLAGEQEVVLRSLIRQQDSVTASASGGVRLDLTAELERLEAQRPPSVSVATPGRPVEGSGPWVGEVLAIVRACLDNISSHVGDDAQAWILLEQVGDDVVLTVRDEGPGIADGRLAQAEAEGRLGISQSIRGRVADLHGTASLSTGSFGTEWEFVVPRR